MILTVLAVWICLAVPAAVFVAALGRSALLDDQALGDKALDHLPGATRTCVADELEPVARRVGPG